MATALVSPPEIAPTPMVVRAWMRTVVSGVTVARTFGDG
jgi:hypothetical protein